MTHTQAVCLATLATLVLGGVYFTRTGHAPAGQPKLVELKVSSLSTLQAGFNRESGKLRVILLLSPTCPTCLEGTKEPHAAYSNLDGVVWLLLSPQAQQLQYGRHPRIVERGCR